MKILVADDSPTTRSFLKVLLNLADADLLEAADGERAYRVARLVPLDLIIADVNMPKLDGISLVQKLRAEAEPRLRTLPVVLLTGDKSPEVERRGWDAGATAFARKPISADELTQILRRITTPRSPAEPSPPSARRPAR